MTDQNSNEMSACVRVAAHPRLGSGIIAAALRARISIMFLAKQSNRSQSNKTPAQTSACVRAAAHSEIAAAISYEYDKAQMITGITRNAQTARFAYDKTYQLNSERGQYQTNASLAGAGMIVTTQSVMLPPTCIPVFTKE